MMRIPYMKKYLLLLFLLPISTTYGQLTISSNDVEKVYTEAIDARFSGDLAKSRNLLENLKENNFTNEFVMGLLVEVYGEYLNQLVQNKDQATFQNAYPGIRQNITQVWDMYPNSENIQNNGLKIALLVSDLEMGAVMAQLVLQNDPFHALANYTMGFFLTSQQNYYGAILFLKKVANAPIVSGQEQFVYQSRLYLGDIYLNSDDKLESLKYYKKATELASTLELIAKTAALESYFLNYPTAIGLFQMVPVMAMTDELYHSYIATLWLSENPDHRMLLNSLLSYQNSSALTEALVQAQLGRTQKALEMLQNESILKESRPGLYYSIRLNLLSRIGKQEYQTDSMLGMFYNYIKQNDKSKLHLTNLDSALDTEGSVAYTLGLIAKSEWDYDLARDYLTQSLSKQKTLSTYTELIEIEANLKNFSQAEHLISEALEELQPDPIWGELLQVCILLSQNKLEESEQKLLSLREQAPNVIDSVLSTVYMESEQYEKAEELLIQQYNIDPYNSIIQNQLAYYYSLVGKELDKALTLALSIMEEHNEDIIYLDTLAWVYVARKDYELAQPIFDKIEEKLQNIKTISSFVDIYAHLGYFYAKIGDTQKSQEFFNKGLSINSNNRYIQKLSQEAKEE